MLARTKGRFSDIPPQIDIPVQGMDDEEAVEVDLEDLLDDPTELCTLLENEKVTRTFWMTISLAYAKQKKTDVAIEMLQRGLAVVPGGPKEKLSMHSALCWAYLWKSREAPRVAPEALVGEAKTKEYYLQLATTALNDATRISPSFPPLFLARGVLYLLKASLQPPTKAPGVGLMDPEKADLLRNALIAFDNAIRVSGGRNMLAVLGKARAHFSQGKYAEALEGYQEVLHRMPELADPDPRIGIGCCFWALGHKEDAKAAWERSLEINDNNKTANILLGLYHLDASGHVPVNSHEFVELYKKAMTVYTQKAFKLDKDLPLTCATFAGYFLTRKSLANVDALAHKAIQQTDVNAIASDGWYLLARKEHYSENYDRAADYYRRSDEARGGADRGYPPAKLGAAQLAALRGDRGEAKFRLEKLISQSKNVEAMILLGTIYAEEIFETQDSNSGEDKTQEFKKAIQYLEQVRTAWKDPKKGLVPDPSVLIHLARLYEADHPEKSVACLQQMEQIEFQTLPEEDQPKDEDEEKDVKKRIHENLPPQLLNNMGCFQYQVDKYEQAREFYEAALSACVREGAEEKGFDTDALVTTISFNLGRTYEASGLLDEAKTVYEGLLERHADYIDARTRLAYIALKQSPTEEGPRTIGKLYQENYADLEVRALYGWYLGRVHSRKRPADTGQDPEYRHYKHTLQGYDKHDKYSLIGMGNIGLQQAREMRRDTESEKAKRSAAYCKAVEFFEKALQLDPKNAYAAQGIAIAMIEDRKDFKGALSIFMQIRETLKDANVYVNLGHIFAELRQYSKSIEHYELALAKDRGHDAQILACLGRTWLAKGRAEKNLPAYKSALEYAKKVCKLQSFFGIPLIRFRPLKLPPNRFISSSTSHLSKSSLLRPSTTPLRPRGQLQNASLPLLGLKKLFYHSKPLLNILIHLTQRILLKDVQTWPKTPCENNLSVRSRPKRSSKRRMLRSCNLLSSKDKLNLGNAKRRKQRRRRLNVRESNLLPRRAKRLPSETECLLSREHKKH
jgi:RNA polymerase-associated protein CTR9